MTFDHHFQAYKHNGGKKKIVKLIDKDNSAYIAEYILDDTVEVLVTMTDDEVRHTLEVYLSVAEASSYSKELQKNYMARTTTFNREASSIINGISRPKIYF